MDWLIDIFTNTESVAHIVLLYSLVISIGVLLGKIKFGGISLGVTFVLFAGIVAGHIGFTAPIPIITFLQEFGLVLFVFMIGLQVGPGFFESFGTAGVKMNALSAVLILLNILVMFGCYYAFFDTSNSQNLSMLVGTLYGAVTNTPGLGAANEAHGSVFSENPPQIASGYACAYPLGVLGIIGATIAIRFLCNIKLEKEEKRLLDEDAENVATKPCRLRLKVTNSYLEGKTMLQVHDFVNRDFVCSRILHDNHVSIPNRNTVFHIGDILNIVSAETDREALIAFFGPETDIDWEEQDQPMISKRIVVTNPSINGKTLGKMHFSSVHGVNVTRVTRHGIELFASASLPLQVGDRIMVVGPKDAVERVTTLMGNSTRKLNAPNIATIFIGIIIGLVTYTTTSANMMLREIGLVLFLASVGIKAGAGFWETVVQGDGLLYVLSGFLITTIPIIIIGTIGRKRFRFNYFTLMGMLAGTYTDPPALAYANSICSKDAPALGYSTVYPLSMFLRIFTAQIIVLFFCG